MFQLRTLFRFSFDPFVGITLGFGHPDERFLRYARCQDGMINETPSLILILP